MAKLVILAVLLATACGGAVSDPERADGGEVLERADSTPGTNEWTPVDGGSEAGAWCTWQCTDELGNVTWCSGPCPTEPENG